MNPQKPGDDPHPTTGETWASTFGSVLVGAMFLLLMLTVVAGWTWVAKFLESAAPAWIQAIGSVAAIIAALVVVQKQHTFELQRREREDHTVQLRRARTLSIIFFSAARVCEDVARRIGKPHQTWRFRAGELREVRSRILAIDPLLVPDGSLLLIIEDCAMRLQSCAVIVEELASPRKKETLEGVRTAVMATARDCWLGVYEATGIEAKLCRERGLEQPYSVNDFTESRKKLDEIREKFQSKNEGDIPSEIYARNTQSDDQI